jgi:hypothetical protein
MLAMVTWRAILTSLTIWRTICGPGKKTMATDAAPAAMFIAWSSQIKNGEVED